MLENSLIKVQFRMHMENTILDNLRNKDRVSMLVLNLLEENQPAHSGPVMWCCWTSHLSKPEVFRAWDPGQLHAYVNPSENEAIFLSEPTCTLDSIKTIHVCG